MEARRVQMGPVQYGIIVLTLATAFIHFYLNVLMGRLDLMFTMNGLGYLALLAALFLPIPFLQQYRPVIRTLFILYTLLTITLWAIFGMRTPVGFIDKAIEVALVVLLFLDRGRG